MISQLLRNLELNGLKRNGRLEFHSKFLRAVNSSDSMAADYLANRVTTPCFLKMDIEGGELEVLRAAPRLLTIRGLRWLIETHGDRMHQECEALLKSAGYSTRYIPQAWWRVFLPELRGQRVGWLVATN